MSDYAKQKFIEINHDWHPLKDVLKKAFVIHPNVPIYASKGKTYSSDHPLQIVFIGHAFARKGGIVALRVADKARKIGLPVVFHLVSKLLYGSIIYTDHPDKQRYEKDLKLLELPNVIFHGKLTYPNVIELLTKSHFQMMATLDDTYGFSIVEGFSVGTPAITTNVCALPEFVHSEGNGYLIELPLNESRNWISRKFYFEYCGEVFQRRRNSEKYWEILDETYEILADQTLELIIEIVNHPEKYTPLSEGALAQALDFHNSQAANSVLDNLYSKIVNV
ncbi:MAG: glycosyltransferase family 4 protein [Leptolyngbya sp. SIO1E4]|nr:glycosyltransferase family 4 protein [Leptolyngbya sp. SIO1E4]